MAKNSPHGSNVALNVCENCEPGNTTTTFTPGHCYEVTNYTSYWLTEWAPVHGADDMKKEIYARGPISCGIDGVFAC